VTPAASAPTSTTWVNEHQFRPLLLRLLLELGFLIRGLALIHLALAGHRDVLARTIEMYSPAAIENEPASRPATPANQPHPGASDRTAHGCAGD
jgi:hypothetical protein